MRAVRSSFLLVALVVTQLVASVPLDGGEATMAVQHEEKVAEVIPSQDESSSFHHRTGEVHDSSASNTDRDSRHLKNEPKEENSVSSIGLRQFLYPFFPQGTGRGSWKPITVGTKNEGTPARRSTSASSPVSCAASTVFFLSVIARISLEVLSS